jgi:hypothetical protein
VRGGKKDIYRQKKKNSSVFHPEIERNNTGCPKVGIKTNLEGMLGCKNENNNLCVCLKAKYN